MNWPSPDTIQRKWILFLYALSGISILGLIYNLMDWTLKPRNSKDEVFQMMIFYVIHHICNILFHQSIDARRKKETELTNEAVKAIEEGDIDQLNKNSNLENKFEDLKQDGQSLLMVAISKM
jgi:hypothetical protein